MTYEIWSQLASDNINHDQIKQLSLLVIFNVVFFALKQEWKCGEVRTWSWVSRPGCVEAGSRYLLAPGSATSSGAGRPTRSAPRRSTTTPSDWPKSGWTSSSTSTSIGKRHYLLEHFFVDYIRSLVKLFSWVWWSDWIEDSCIFVITLNADFVKIEVVVHWN